MGLHRWSKGQSQKHDNNQEKNEKNQFKHIDGSRDECQNAMEVKPHWKFEVQHEFNGLIRGVFPVDAAVYCNDELVALIEIDGEFHYKQLGQQLRRKDQLK